MSKTISNSDDIIDSRDVIERIEELESEIEELGESNGWPCKRKQRAMPPIGSMVRS